MTTNRYTLKPSDKEGFWTAEDAETGLKVEFKENNYNEEQKATLDRPENLGYEPEKIATELRKMGDWLQINYPHVVFTSDELKVMLTNMCVSIVSKAKEANNGEEIDLYMNEYVDSLSREGSEVVKKMLDRIEALLSREDFSELLDRIEFKCEIENRGIRHAIGDRVSLLREEANLTQVELANLAGISRSNMINIEAGKYSVGIDIIHRIACALGKEVYIL